MIDHDRLFKELLSTFFVEFLELFLPEMLTYLEPKSITFLDKEIFTDVTAGDKYETDLLAQVQFQGEPSFFLIHVENQASSRANFGKRMFRYFARLHEQHDCPIYPIVVFSYDQPLAPATTTYTVDFPDLSVLRFNYRAIQLNQLNWRDFINQSNPIAAALMAKMKIEPTERAKVKAECLRLLVTLRLDPARMQLISGFVDTYLRLTPSEESEFVTELAQEAVNIREEVMEIVTSWQLRGREEGREEGRRSQERLVKALLGNQLGQLPIGISNQVSGLSTEQLEQLGVQASTLDTVNALANWLNHVEATEGFADSKVDILNALREQVGAIAPKQKQKLLSLSEQQWQTLATLKPENIEALDNWLSSESH